MHLLEKYGAVMIAPALAGSRSGDEKFIHGQKANGWTALHLAAGSDHADMIDLLIDAGCDRTIRNRNGQTALDVARAQQRSRAILRLESTRRNGGNGAQP